MIFLSLATFGSGISRAQFVAGMDPNCPQEPPAQTWVLPDEVKECEDICPNIDLSTDIFGEQVGTTQETSVAPATPPTVDLREVKPSPTHTISWSRIWDFVRGVALGVGLVAGYRGVKKLLSESKQERTDRFEFITDTSLSLAKANLHRVQEKNGLLVFDIITVDRISLSHLFENATATKIFQSAARKCTVDQPLIHNALDEFKFPWSVRLFAAIRLLAPPSAKKLKAWFNTALTEYYSKEASEGPAAKEFYPLRKDREIHFVIPCCDVDKDGSRSIVLRILPRYQFEYFNDPAFVVRLKRDNPHFLDQIEQIEKAYAAHQKFQTSDSKFSPAPKRPEHPSSNEPLHSLFPWVCVHRMLAMPKTPGAISA